MTTSITLNDLYARQIALIGKEAFLKIRQAKVLVIGAGGLGCPALQYLASSAIGKIGIMDFDQVSASNLQRQILFQVSDLGKKKVDVARDKLAQLAPFCEWQVHPHFLNSLNAEDIISTYDLILDCTDNFQAKFLIHDVCLMTKKVLIQASVYQYEGQLQVFDFRDSSGPCLRCLWPKEPQDGCVGTCAEVGVMGPLLGVMGSLQAAEAIKIFCDQTHLKNGESLFVDLLTLSFDLRRFGQLKECAHCVKREFVLKDSREILLPLELDKFIILDVRSHQEVVECSLYARLKNQENYLQVPLDNISKFRPIRGRKYLTVCSSGKRSLIACNQLIEQNIKAYSLRGGISSLISEE